MRCMVETVARPTFPCVFAGQRIGPIFSGKEKATGLSPIPGSNAQPMCGVRFPLSSIARAPGELARTQLLISTTIRFAQRSDPVSFG